MGLIPLRGLTSHMEFDPHLYVWIAIRLPRWVIACRWAKGSRHCAGMRLGWVCPGLLFSGGVPC